MKITSKYTLNFVSPNIFFIYFYLLSSLCRAATNRLMSSLSRVPQNADNHFLVLNLFVSFLPCLISLVTDLQQIC